MASCVPVPSTKKRKTWLIVVVVASVEVDYGPDLAVAEAIDGNGLNDVTSMIAKGRSKTGQYGFAVPIEHMDELPIDVSDYEHDLFSWSVK